VVIGGVWATTHTPAPSEAPMDATAVEQPKPDAGAPTPRHLRLEWRVEGATMPTAATLEACLREEGLEAGSVAGTPQSGLTIHHPEAPRIQHLETVEGALILRTPVDANANRTARRHVLVTLCLYGPDAVVVDEVHGRREGSDWPQLGPTGGLPIETVVALRQQGNTWTTHGLSALDRRELGVTFPPGRDAVAKLLIRKAAATSIGGEPGRARLQWADGRARLVSSAAASRAGWWTGPTAPTLWVLAEAVGPSRPVEMPAIATPPKRAPARPRPTRSRRRPRPPKKAFWPDYR